MTSIHPPLELKPSILFSSLSAIQLSSCRSERFRSQIQIANCKSHITDHCKFQISANCKFQIADHCKSQISHFKYCKFQSQVCNLNLNLQSAIWHQILTHPVSSHMARPRRTQHSASEA